MAKFLVPVRWQATELVTVEADSVEEAVEKAGEVEMDFNNVSFDCPEIDEDEVEEVD